MEPYDEHKLEGESMNERRRKLRGLKSSAQLENLGLEQVEAIRGGSEGCLRF